MQPLALLLALCLLVTCALAAEFTVKDLITPDLAGWATSMSPEYYKGDTGQKGLQLVEDPERGQVLACDVRYVDPEKSEPCFITRTFDTPLPQPRVRTVTFWYKLTGLDANPQRQALESFKVRLRTSDTEFTDYDVLTTQPTPVDRWVKAEIDTKPGATVRNIWGKIFGNVREMTFRLDDIDSEDAHFTLLLDDIEITMDEAGAEQPYMPREYSLKRDPRLDVLLIRHAAAGYYSFDPVLASIDEQANVRRFPFKGLHFNLDLFGFPQTIQPLLNTDLIVLVDVDPFILSPEQAAWVADLVYSGAGLLFFGGQETLAKSRDFKRPLAEVLPVTFGTEPQMVTRAVKLPDGSTAYATNAQKLAARDGAEVLVDGEDRPIIVQGEFGKGRVAVINALPYLDREDDLFLQPSWTPLLQRLMLWATRREDQRVAAPPAPVGMPEPADLSQFPPLDREGFFPIITIAGSGASGHYLDEEDVRADLQRMKDYGFNTIAVTGLSSIARNGDKPNQSDRNAWLIKHLAHELGMATIFEYTGFNYITADGPTSPCVFSPEYPQALAAKLQPQVDVAGRVPRLLSVKILDEPTVSPKNMDYCEHCQRVFEERYGQPLRKFEEIPADDYYGRWAFADFLGHYLAEGYRQGYEFKQQSGAKFDLLLTYMSPGLGYGRTLTGQEDALDWGRYADRMDFDVYPYFYPASQKIRMVQAAWCLAFQRQIAQHLRKPWGFYFELDDRNWPFQQNPKQASAECAYEAIMHGANYLNSFIHLHFATGCDSRPERWEWTGQELRKISDLGPLLARTERRPSPVAIFYPTAQTFITNEPVPKPYTYACASSAFGEVDVLPEEVALEQREWAPRVLVMLGCDILHADTARRLVEWVRGGGLLVLDRVPARDHRGQELSLPFSSDGPGDGPAALQPYYVCEVGKGKVVRLSYDFESVYKDAIESDRQAEAAGLRAQLAELLGLTGAKPSAVVADKHAQMEVGVRQGRNEALVVVANHHAARNEGTVTLRLPFKPGYAVDAVTKKPVAVQATADAYTFRVSLPEREARMVYLSRTRP
jgi:hypothetical protein